MAEIAIWKEDWLFKIPEGLSNENAAPLMCMFIHIPLCFMVIDFPPKVVELQSLRRS